MPEERKQKRGTRRIFPIHGGLNLPMHKALTTAQPIRQAPVPPELVLPLHQHIGEEATPCVETGARVLRGQMIAKANGYVGAAVHASSSGTIAAIEQRPVPHPSGMNAPCIVIRTDGRDEPLPARAAGSAYSDRTPVELRAEIRQRGIVGLGGAAFPTAVKLNRIPQRPVDLLIRNGAECEPYISCDDMLMRERPREIILGTQIMMHLLDAKECIVAIERDKPEAEAALRTALDEAADSRIEIVGVPTVYPEGGEKQLIQVLTGKEVPTDGLTSEIGIVCQNVATAEQVKHAIVDGEALTTRIVTVTGRGIAEPANLEVRLGTPVSWLVQQCGGYRDPIDRLIMGGPMMGFTLDDDSVPVVKASNCIIVAAPDEVHAGGDSLACIRCGECARACPANLLPQQLYWYAREGNHDKLQSHHLFDCIECGCCAYVCPSHIPLVQYYRAAKSRIWTSDKERERADHARERFQSRERRLAEQEAARKERLRRRREAIRSPEAAGTIADAVERARKRRRENSSSGSEQ